MTATSMMLWIVIQTKVFFGLKYLRTFTKDSMNLERTKLSKQIEENPKLLGLWTGNKYITEENLIYAENLILK